MEQDKNIYTVDFKDVHYYQEIHNALKKGLGLPDYYGANLDALWDCLTDFIDNDDIIVLKSFQFVEKANEEYAEKVLSVFRDVKHYANDASAGVRIIVERDGVGSELE